MTQLEYALATGSKPCKSGARYYLPRSLHSEKGIVITPTRPRPISPLPCRRGIDSNEWCNKRDKRRRKRAVNTPTKSIAPKSAVQRKEISERRGKCRCHSYSVESAGSKIVEPGYRTTDSYGNNDAALETWRSISSRRVVWAPLKRASRLAAFGERGGYRAEPPVEIERKEASSWRCVRRERPASRSVARAIVGNDNCSSRLLSRRG